MGQEFKKIGAQFDFRLRAPLSKSANIFNNGCLPVMKDSHSRMMLTQANIALWTYIYLTMIKDCLTDAVSTTKHNV